MPSIIENYYDDSTEREWSRLEQHRTEFAVTLRALADHLLAPPATVLDVGGGPGRYSIALAQQGYTVTLLDLSSRALEYARGKAAEAGVELAGYVHGDALDLPAIPDETYDAVLLMGPLYHLLEESERRRAILEARRVLKPGGPLFAAFITRYGPLRFAAKTQPDLLLTGDLPGQVLLETGQHRPKPGGRFTQAYFAHPGEIQPLMESCGFRTVGMVGCEGLVSQIEEQVNDLSGELWDAWVDVNYHAGKDPYLYGAAEHLLYIGTKG
jgi:ubiquinone/menaquinone biosynthesis C-methylase UbiE